MNIVTVSIFILAALLGVTLITYILANKNVPKGLAIIHGSIAGIGILLLIVLLFVADTKPYFSLIFFIVAAIGGFFMMYRDIIGKPLPKWFAVGHGFIAAIGFILLLLAVFW